MGAVYDGVDISIGRRVAIKVMLDHKSDPRNLERFRREALAAAGLAHPHIIQVTDFVTPQDEPAFIVMERLEGSTLAEELSRTSPLPIDRALGIAMQTAGALAAAHAAGIVHRDIKPQNLFLVRSLSGADFVKVLDFGIAKMSDGAVTTTGAVLGTVSYMSPEQAMGSREVGPPSDVFAVGLLLYKMLSGRLPHTGTTPGEVVAALFRGDLTPLATRMPAMPEGVTRLVDRCLAVAPEQRFPDARALLAAIEPLVAGGPMRRVDSFGGLSEGPTMREGPPVVAGTTQSGVQTGSMIAGNPYGHAGSVPPRAFAPATPPQSRGAIFAVAFIAPIALVAAGAVGAGIFYLRGRYAAGAEAASSATAPASSTSATASPTTRASAGPGVTSAVTTKAAPGAKVGAPGAPPAATPPAAHHGTTPVLGAWSHTEFRSDADRAPDLAAFRRAEPAIAACLASASMSPCEGLVDPNMVVGVDLSLDASGNVTAVRVASLGCKIDGRFKNVAAEPFHGCVSAAARSVKLGPPRDGAAVSAGFAAPIAWR